MIKVGVWGPIFSGKSAYLRALHSYIRTHFTNSIELVGKDEQATAFLTNSAVDIFVGRPPAPTDGEPYFLNFLLSTVNMTPMREQIHIGMLEGAGRYIQPGAELWSKLQIQLEECACIKIFVDPTKESIKATPHLENLITMLRTKRDSRTLKPPIRLVFCLTKIDDDWDVDYWDEHYVQLKAPKPSIQMLLGEYASQLEQAVEGRVSYVAISAYGRCKEIDGTYVTNIKDIGANTFRVRDPKAPPVHILKPLYEGLAGHPDLPVWWEDFVAQAHECEEEDRTRYGLTARPPSTA